MNKTTTLRMVSLCIVALLLTGCGSETPPAQLPTAQPTAAEGRYIVLGDISDDPINAIEEAQPLADYLAAHLNEYGIAEGRVRVAASMSEMSEMLANGEVDVYFDSVYPATIVSDQTGSQIFIRRWKSGVGEYHTMIFTNKASGITSIEEMGGHTLGVEDNFSTSGYMLPLAYLRMNRLGVTPGSGAPNEVVEENRVAYVFTGGDENTIQWVLSGRVDAGAVENGTFEETEPATRDQLLVLAETESLPRHVGVARPGLEPELLQALTVLLLNATESEEGRQALQAFSKTARFDEFPQGLEAATVRIRELVALVQDAG